MDDLMIGLQQEIDVEKENACARQRGARVIISIMDFFAEVQKFELQENDTLARFTEDVDMAESDESFFKILLYILYLGYDTHELYIKQVEMSMRAAKTAFRKTFGVELKF